MGKTNKPILNCSKQIAHLQSKGVKFEIISTADAEKYLNDNLSFPFDAEISEFQDEGPLQEGDKIRVHGLMSFDYLYLILVKIRLSRKVYHSPLCDIEDCDKNSENFKIIDDYCVWFANR